MRRLIVVLMVALLPAQLSLAWATHGWSHEGVQGNQTQPATGARHAAMKAQDNLAAAPIQHAAHGQHQCHLTDLLGLPSRLIMVHQAPEHSFSAKIPHAGHAALAPPLPYRPPMPVLAA
jgi:hypothetical protein